MLLKECPGNIGLQTPVPFLDQSEHVLVLEDHSCFADFLELQSFFFTLEWTISSACTRGL